tara:strand:+ start:244 stop:780 length:537 start_codon:yes stop_codon:yes gene_type:complete
VAGGARDLAGIRGTLAECKVIAQHENDAGQHMVISDTRNRHRVLLAREPSPGIDGYVVPDDADLGVRVAALSEFHRSKEGAATKAHHRLLKPSAYKRYRLSILLAILDMLEDASPKQVTLRELAKALIYPGLKAGRAIDWKTSSQRRQTQRLVAEAHRMAAEGYRELLTPSRGKRRAN